jgi:hypothetical protein
MADRKTEQRQAAAVVIGGVSLFIVLLTIGIELSRTDRGIVYAVLLIGTILWREYEFTGMRVELAKLRKQHAATATR